ncbi:unnamed protein product [Orchesella dallaii]|uniref:BHLH domain-containing protein n=1 Tax=Orchesella dallaii TaxID=48710 RepID=A0ABP1QTA4_9HEXA
MKAQIESSRSANSGGVRDGKVRKAKHCNQKEEENVEIREYLNKLQDLVPCMPKNKRLSKLEVISNVIDYIHDLRQTLGLPPCSAVFDMESVLSTSQDGNSQISPDTKAIISTPVSPISPTLLSQPKPTHHHQRQPLCVISNPR